MLIPHLLFAHMLADYVLQSNWLVSRKGQGWEGLALHGFIVFAMSLLVLPAQIPLMFIPILVMSVVHTIQDWGKIWSGPRIKIHPFIPYMIDQVLHYIQILILQSLYGARLNPAPGQLEIWVMASAASVVTVTRFYDVTWWANWLDMLPFMNRWRWWGYAERLAMVALATAGLVLLAPLCVLPRLLYAWYCRQPIWKQRRGLLEVGIGVVFSCAIGLVLRLVLP